MNYFAEFLQRLLTPAVLLAGIAAAGIAVGKVRVAGISLSTAGVLVSAVFYGTIVSVFPKISVAGHSIVLYSQAFEEKLSFLSTAATALFMAAIGLEAGKNASIWGRKQILAIITGITMVLGGGIVIVLAKPFFHSLSSSACIGTFAGSLTSTPALSTAAEFPKISYPELVSGYGISYIFGVFSIVFFVQICLRHEKNQEVSMKKEINGLLPGLKELLIIFLIIVFGGIIGSAEVPGIHFSLGAAAATLLAAIFIGRLLTKKGVCLSEAALEILKKLGLISFLLATGIKGGASFIQKSDIMGFFLGVAVTIGAIFVGWVMTSKFFKMNKTDRLSILCGGMTSTPAVGVLSQEGKAELSLYTAAYTGALTALVLFTRIFCRLFC